MISKPDQLNGKEVVRPILDHAPEYENIKKKIRHVENPEEKMSVLD